MHEIEGEALSFLANGAGWQRWFFVVLALAISVVLVVCRKNCASSATNSSL